MKSKREKAIKWAENTGSPGYSVLASAGEPKKLVGWRVRWEEWRPFLACWVDRYQDGSLKQARDLKAGLNKPWNNSTRNAKIFRVYKRKKLDKKTSDSVR